MELSADCSRCFALCCVVPAFARSADFAIDKPAGRACPNLRGDYRCGIHESLREKGFKGCTVYDCFGAGQHVSQVTFGGRFSERVYEVFPVMGRLHELAYYLTEAVVLGDSAAADLLNEIEELTRLDADALLALDLPPYWRRVDAVLTRVSAEARRGLPGRSLRSADLIGADLRGEDLRGADLRGARLIGADLRRADLRGADVIGADLRGADLRGARLAGVLFLTRMQLDSAAFRE